MIIHNYSITRNIVFHLLITLAAYSLFDYYNGTKAGKRFSQKTIQQAKREEGHPQNMYYPGGLGIFFHRY